MNMVFSQKCIMNAALFNATTFSLM